MILVSIRLLILSHEVIGIKLHNARGNVLVTIPALTLFNTSLFDHWLRKAASLVEGRTDLILSHSLSRTLPSFTLNNPHLTLTWLLRDSRRLPWGQWPPLPPGAHLHLLSDSSLSLGYIYFFLSFSVQLLSCQGLKLLSNNLSQVQLFLQPCFLSSSSSLNPSPSS